MFLRNLILSTGWSEWSASPQSLYRLGHSPSTHWIEGWENLRALFQRWGVTEYLLPLSGIDSLVVCPWHSCYTNWALWAPGNLGVKFNFVSNLLSLTPTNAFRRGSNRTYIRFLKNVSSYRTWCTFSYSLRKDRYFILRFFTGFSVSVLVVRRHSQFL